MLTADDLRRKLDSATEDHVAAALAREGAYVAPPLTEPADLLEFFHLMVDAVLGERET